MEERIEKLEKKHRRDIKQLRNEMQVFKDAVNATLLNHEARLVDGDASV